MTVGYLPPRGLYNQNPSQFVECVAPLQLSHGAIITNITFYYYDNDSDFLRFFFLRENQTDFDILGIAFSPSLETPGYDHVSFSSPFLTNVTTIDNNNYLYFLGIQIPAAASSDSYGFQYARVEYEFPT